ncbi:hypothetical protein [Pantoea sp. KPR_PJ]|uniref:hypothetical protein n=1 Tax=Pantoea sp. KPR_PJ TaxID=2738375 RepID=UPI003527D46C
MVRKETAPFANPWLLAIDSTEQKLIRYALSSPVPETAHSLWHSYHSLMVAQKQPARVNGWLFAKPPAASISSAVTPPEETYQQLLPTLMRISQRLQTQEPWISSGNQEESVEVALRVARKQRAGRLK